MSKEELQLAALVAQERGIPLDDIISSTVQRANAIKAERSSSDGKYTVLCVDKYDHDHSIYGRFDTEEEALKIAREQTDKAKSFATDHSIATVYLAYDPNGEYLGGDTWVKE
ncbi:MAG: hypothetical protein ACTSUV_06840 [Candidatus Ranarchaeia archaeon]